MRLFQAASQVFMQSEFLTLHTEVAEVAEHGERDVLRD